MSGVVGERRETGPYVAYILLAAACMSTLANVLIAPNLPQIQAHFADVEGADYWVPMMLTTPQLFVAALALFVGAIVDKIGRKIMLIGAMAAYGIFGTAPSWLESLDMIILSRAGVGVTEAVIMTCCTALVGDYYSGVQREKYLALQTTFASVSAVVFMSIGGALGEYGWRVPFYVYAVSILFVPLYIRSLWEPTKSHDAETEAARAKEAEALPFRPGLLAWICGVSLVGAVTFLAMQIHLGYLMEGIGITSTRTIGNTAALSQVGVAAGTFLFRYLATRRMPISYRLALAFGLSAVGFLVVAEARDLTIMIVGAVIGGLGGGIMLPALLTWNMSKLPFAHRGLGTGAWMATFFFGQFLTPLIIVWTSKQVGGLVEAFAFYGWVWVAATALAVFAGAVTRNRSKA